MLYTGSRVKLLLYRMPTEPRVPDASRETLAALVQRALDEGPFSIQQLADEIGVSYDSLYSWAKGRRVPRPENLGQLAAGFDDRAERLRRIAHELRGASESL